MPELWPSWATLDPGADWQSNASRVQQVRAVTLHKPQGTCPGVVSVGVGRHHSTPGTFNATLCYDGRLHIHYPWNVRCSHAAGGNAAGPGVEIEDYQGRPLSDAQLVTLGRLARWTRDQWGVPLDYYDGSTGRIWLDVHPWRGWVPHAAIDYPPNRAYLHYDGLLPGEWQRALATIDTPEEEDDMAYIAVGDALAGRVAAVMDGGRVIGDLFTGPTDPYGVPKSAAEWNAQPGRGLRFVFFDRDRFAALITPPATVTGAPAPTKVEGTFTGTVR